MTKSGMPHSEALFMAQHQFQYRRKNLDSNKRKKVKLFLCLIKYHAMERIPPLIKHNAMKMWEWRYSS